MADKSGHDGQHRAHFIFHMTQNFAVTETGHEALTHALWQIQTLG